MPEKMKKIIEDEEGKVEVPMNEAEVEVLAPDVESKDVIASKEDIDKNTDAVKELTKVVAEGAQTLAVMKATHDKWVRAGKF